jgi:hypothetical protein
LSAEIVVAADDGSRTFQRRTALRVGRSRSQKVARAVRTWFVGHRLAPVPSGRSGARVIAATRCASGGEVITRRRIGFARQVVPEAGA